MTEQIQLFETEEHQPPQQKPRTAPTLRGTIKRGLDELKDSDNWIQRISNLKFDKRKGSTS